MVNFGSLLLFRIRHFANFMYGNIQLVNFAIFLTLFIVTIGTLILLIVKRILNFVCSDSYVIKFVVKEEKVSWFSDSNRKKKG